MPVRLNNEGVRIIYHREGFESPIGHHVRNKMEAAVCEWLVAHGIAHRHASEVFTVSSGPAGAPSVFVPDIVLHDKANDGRIVIVEPVHSYSPKGRGTRILAAFRRQMKKKYFVIIVAKKHYMHKILKNAYDVLIDFDRLDLLEGSVPRPDQRDLRG